MTSTPFLRRKLICQGSLHDFQASHVVENDDQGTENDFQMNKASVAELLATTPLSDKMQLPLYHRVDSGSRPLCIYALLDLNA